MRNCRIIAIGSLLIASIMVYAGRWTTYFAYNNVTQIAMSPDKVYAVSDGSLYSVDKMTEQIEVYSRQSGLHGTGITCIHYDVIGEQLIICYSTGKIDILSSNGVQYVSGLYDKDMTQRKTIYNVTIQGRTAYLSTHYGVQTMDLRERTMIDSYWLRPNGIETPVKDVLLQGDSIYAFTDDSLFCASRQDNIVDYSVWKRELRSGRISPDEEKGVHYQDATSHWYRGYTEGIVRFTATERLTYKPDGPVSNMPYSLTALQGQVWVVQGGRWSSQYERAGHVMHFDGTQWHNILNSSINAFTGIAAKDFMNIAVDTSDLSHFYVTSYGTGLYEFRGDSCVSHLLTNEVAGSAVPRLPAEYTRYLGGHYAGPNRLYFADAGEVPYHIIVKDGTNYYGMLSPSTLPFFVEIPADIIIDRRNENHKWLGIAAKKTGAILVDDNGTIADNTDDQNYYRNEWINQNGQSFKPSHLLCFTQDSQNRIWLLTDIGAAYIDAETDFTSSNAIVQPHIIDNNGENPITSQRMLAFCETEEGQIWLGSANLGVYVLNSSCTEMEAHFTTENSALPSNSILSLASDKEGKIWIGTAEGLVLYEPNESGEGFTGMDKEDEQALDKGEMLQWKLHFSYSDPQEIAGSPDHIYAIANGSLFSVDRADESMTQWSKATGLNGSTIAHIAYSQHAGKLIICYEDGRIDLVHNDGSVEQMPDIFMKAGSIPVSIHHICIGSKYTYLSMPFGIVAIDPGKAEVIETYYIGSNASAVEVQQVIEAGDSLYAFSYDRLYRASKKDNIIDYSFWTSHPIPFEKIDQACLYNHHIYVLDNDSLYRNDGLKWSKVSQTMAFSWIHVSGNQLLTYAPGTGLMRMDEDEKFTPLSNRYIAKDAIYTNGEYWLGEDGQGLVRLGKEGDDFYRPEGPLNNYGYNLQTAHGQVYVSPGGRWSAQDGRQSSLSIYDGQQWRGIPWPDTWYYTGHDIRDAVSYAVDHTNPGHFYVATYGTGLFEFENYKAVQHYDSANSTLRKAVSNVSNEYFTRTDGAMIDEQGNLWVLNATAIGDPVHIKSPTGVWKSLRLRSNGTDLSFSTPGPIWTDRRDSRYKWMIDQRLTSGVIFFYDGGNPTDSKNHRCLKRNIFVDQNNNTLSPTYIYCLTQDQKNRVWIGTEKGIIIIPSEVDFYKSNACKRIIIPRNDGTGLGDYLLGEEQIKCIAVDGGNRMWIGTANSGVFVIEDDTITVSHFTENNSLLPSNNILSIAIMPNTGEVFVGTSKGIASYRADASEAVESMSNAYAYPNPVRPDYGGYITITGLMDNTVVNIIDAGGNLVCKTRSHGGTAVWDGKLPDGRRATAGVYTALCNAEKGHAAVKILVIR